MPNIRELMAMASSPDKIRNDVIDQILSHGGYMVIGADRDSGKTNEALHLVCKFASKKPQSYHGLKMKPCGALYVNFEDNTEKIGERLGKISAFYDLAYEPEFEFLESIHLNTSDGKSTVNEMVCKYRQEGYAVDVVVFDSLKFTVLGQITKPETMLTWAKSVKELARGLNIAIVFLHHTRKLVFYQGHIEDLYTADRIKGAGEIVDHSDTTLLYAVESKVVRNETSLHRERHDALVAIRHRNATVDLASCPLYMIFDRRSLQWRGDSWKVDKGTLSVNREEILV